jgi:PAS domain S-box-containing protein
MNIAVVGGGSRCRLLLELIEKHAFQELDPNVVAVADVRNNAPGLVKAKEKGLIVTNDYNDFFDRDDIDLIIELTGNQKTFFDILFKKKKTVRAINHRTAQLFWDVSRVFGIQEKTKSELERIKTMYHVLINDLIQEDFMIIDLNYRILDVNDFLLKKLGLERGDVIGRYCYEITHRQNAPCSGKEHPCPIVHVIETQEHFRAIHSHLDKENNELYYSVTCYPIFENDEIIGVVEISRDITKDINMQRALMKQDKLVSLGRLSAGVAHEINNPLTTILTTSMLLQEECEPGDKICKELQTISDETLRCRKIVTSLLDFARETKPAKKPISINDIIDECLVLTKKQAAFDDVNMETKLSDNLPRINVDKDQIQQALINLLLNALASTDSGGLITISTAFLSLDEAVEIAVNDTGEGIPGDKIDKIFDPFFTTRESGTGLGLAITHGIIERHGGSIDVKSKMGHGTTFTIRIPVNPGNEDGH